MSVFSYRRYGKTMLFCPRGPVFSHDDLETFRELMRGAFALGKKLHAYGLRIDPTVPRSDQAFAAEVRRLGGKILFVADHSTTTSQPHVEYTLSLKDRSLDDIFASFGRDYRYKIRRSAKYETVLKTATREDLPQFHQLLVQTAERKSFHGQSLSYFQTLFDELGERNVHLQLAYLEDELIAGALLLCYGTTATYLYGASSTQHRDVLPNYLIQWTLIQWAKEQGFDTYSFGGIPGYQDENNPAYGVYYFKKGFHGEIEEYVGEVNFPLRRVAYALRETLLPKLRAARNRILRRT